MVLGEAHAVSAFGPSQFTLGEPPLEHDTSFSQELDDVGSRHAVSIGATSFDSRSAIGHPAGHETDCVPR